MEVSVEVDVEHLAGPCRVRVTTPIESSATEAFNVALYHEMALALNGQLGAVLEERDRLRFEEEQRSIRSDAIASNVRRPRTATDHPHERHDDDPI